MEFIWCRALCFLDYVVGSTGFPVFLQGCRAYLVQPMTHVDFTQGKQHDNVSFTLTEVTCLHALGAVEYHERP